jgi:hypothetical protein
MPVTVGVNQLGVVHKASSGMTIAFPDVCKTPAPGGGIPIPYPNVAAAAIAKKQQAAATAQKTSAPTAAKTPVSPKVGVASHKVMGGAEYVNYSFDVKLEGKNVARQMEMELHNLTGKLQTLPAKDPNQWQELLERYAAAAAALYLLKRDDD